MKLQLIQLATVEEPRPESRQRSTNALAPESSGVNDTRTDRLNQQSVPLVALILVAASHMRHLNHSSLIDRVEMLLSESG